MSNEISALLNKLNPRAGVQSGSAAETADSKPARSGTTADGSKITDVDEAVRYIKTVVARDENAIARIRRMKNNQAEHEAQWYQRRLELLEKHKARREGRKKLAEMLQRIGGDASTAPSEASDYEITSGDRSTDTDYEFYRRRIWKQNKPICEFTIKKFTMHRWRCSNRYLWSWVI
ncbi:hypothetical protein BZA70DRAFT_289948 [Myxozyma melibiosi]|uniref:Uncharacterized protein n=1 Tax=Myxozyma melibiosi TaxID=54550 RepID=A0ABR1F440_9ASCO